MRGLSLVVASRGHSSSRCTGLSLSQPLLLQSTGSRRTGSVVVAHGPSCSAACGIFPDQDSNLCPLHWQADSQPLRHQGSPSLLFWRDKDFKAWLAVKIISKWLNEAWDREEQTWSEFKVIPQKWEQRIGMELGRSSVLLAHCSKDVSMFLLIQCCCCSQGCGVYGYWPCLLGRISVSSEDR